MSAGKQFCLKKNRPTHYYVRIIPMFGQYYSCNYNDFKTNSSAWSGIRTLTFQIEPTRLVNSIMENIL